MVLNYASMFQKLGRRQLPSEEYNFGMTHDPKDSPDTRISARYRPADSDDDSEWQEFTDSRLPIFAGDVKIGGSTGNTHRQAQQTDNTSMNTSGPKYASSADLLKRYQSLADRFKHSIQVHRQSIESLNNWTDVSGDENGQSELISEALQAQRAKFFLDKISRFLASETITRTQAARGMEEEEYKKFLSNLQREALADGIRREMIDLKLLKDETKCMLTRHYIRSLMAQEDTFALIGDICLSACAEEHIPLVQKDRQSIIEEKRKEIQSVTKLLNREEGGVRKRFHERYGTSQEIPSNGEGWRSLWSQSRFKSGQSQIAYRLSNLVGDRSNPYERVRPEYKIDPDDPDENWKPIFEPSIPIFNGSVSHQNDQLFSECEVDLSKVVDDTGIPTCNFVNNVRKLLSATHKSKSKLAELSGNNESWTHEGGDLEKEAHTKRMHDVMQILQETLPTVLHIHWNTVYHSHKHFMGSTLDTRLVGDATDEEMALVEKWTDWMRKEVDAKTADAFTELYGILAGLTKDDGDGGSAQNLKSQDAMLIAKEGHEQEAQELSSEFAKSFSVAFPRGSRFPASLDEWKNLFTG